MSGSKAGKTIRRIILILLAAVLILSAAAVGSCLFISRPALNTAEEYGKAFPDVLITVYDDASVELSPADISENNGTGIIFYTGAQINPDAYVPLLARLSQKGFLCFIPKLTFNTALLEPAAAAEIIRDNPEIKEWYFAGHSLGGLTASGFADDHRDLTKGLILIAAYPNRDLSGAAFPVLSVYGDTDGVLNGKLYEKRLPWYPADFEEHIIPGANHAGFGDYGRQPRDNDAKITADEQQAQTAAIVSEWIEKHPEK